MMDGDISSIEADEQEQIDENNKKFLYARAMHANHMIQHHMQEIMEHQRIVNEYRSMADGKRELIPLELDLFKNDPVINQHIMPMIDTDILWYEKTFREYLFKSLGEMPISNPKGSLVNPLDGFYSILGVS